MDGYVCRKCWVKISVFHDFYLHIEEVHQSRERIFAVNIDDETKPMIDPDCPKWYPESLLEVQVNAIDTKINRLHDADVVEDGQLIDDKPIIVSQRNRGKVREKRPIGGIKSPKKKKKKKKTATTSMSYYK